MKVEVLTLAFHEDGVKVFVCSAASIPLRRLFESPVSALESVRLDPACLGAPAAAPDALVRIELAPLRLKGMPAAFQGREGIVVAHSTAQAMAFLLDRWEPEGDGQPDATIREVRAMRASRHKKLWELEDLLLKQAEDDFDFGPRRRHRRRRFRRARFVWKLDDFESTFQPVKAGRATAYLPAQERHFPGDEPPRPYVVVERPLAVGRFQVPQWDVLSTRASEGEASARGCIGGCWFQGPLSRVDGRVLEAFEDHGRLVNLVDGDPLAGEALQARFLVRVPRGAGPSAGRVGPVPAVAASLPAAFLLDSRLPVPLSPDLPVIDAPAEAWAVLLRTSSGVFLPDAPPATAPRSFRALAGGFVVACVPAPLVRGVEA